MTIFHAELIKSWSLSSLKHILSFTNFKEASNFIFIEKRYQYIFVDRERKKDQIVKFLNIDVGGNFSNFEQSVDIYSFFNDFRHDVEESQKLSQVKMISI
jgi:hypothetical protein